MPRPHKKSPARDFSGNVLHEPQTPLPHSPIESQCRLHAVRTATTPDADSFAEWGCYDWVTVDCLGC